MTIERRSIAIRWSGLQRLRLRRGLSRRQTLYLSASVVLGWIALGLIAPLLAPHDPNAVNTSWNEMVPPFAPNSTYWWGTDQLGRDIFSRVLVGLNTSILVGVGVRSAVMVVGIAVGYFAAFSPGWVSATLLRAIDVMLAFPALLVAMAITAILGSGIWTLTLALVIISWPDVAKLVYGEVLSIRELDYIAAARTFGAGPLRILTTHMWRVLAPQLGVAWSVGIPGAIMYEAGLSFFGFGVRPPTPSLGSMINDGRGYVYDASWYLLAPTLTLVVLVVSMNLAGEAFANSLAQRHSHKQ